MIHPVRCGSDSISSGLTPTPARLIWLVLLVLWCPVRPAAGQFEPIRASYDAIPGQPLILAVRPEKGRRPKAQVVLRFPDGREIAGDVAAVRLVRPDQTGHSWLAPGARWEVLGPREAGAGAGGGADSLAWFVLADLPDGVIGQEVWLDGQPIALRWLPRPRLLAARLGFDAERGADNPLADPWNSPLPEAWRDRPDLLAALKPATEDPLRRWRSLLATRGLHPVSDRGVGPITPDLLGSGLVEASARVAPLAERLLEAVASHNQARWRIALARLWAGDPALSLRVRHALGGAGLFLIAGPANETAVVPVWNADDRNAGVLLEMLLDDTTTPAERATRAESWLGSLPELALWVIDDGFRGGSGRIGAMYLRAGNAAAISQSSAHGPEETITRPDLLTTRHAAILRPGGFARDELGRAWFDVRIGGRSWRVPVEPGPIPATPPGVSIANMWTDYSMASWLSHDADARAGVLRDDRLSGLVTRKPAEDGSGVRWHVYLRFAPGSTPTDQARLWIGPSVRTKGVLTISPDGGVDLQQFERAGTQLGEPLVVATRLDDKSARVEIALPEGSVEPDGTLHLGLEMVDGDGNRSSWPRPMLPWQIQPARRVLDTSAWMGGLAP